MDALELEERFIEFAVMITSLAENLNRSFANDHLSKQIIRSGTSPALLYGEARSAESKKDFIHKMSIALKELRETYINLRILKKRGVETQSLSIALSECNELISIMVASLNTSKRYKN
ncbi:four helix bundle protein [Balneola sp. MJW-20]|uniref:four helix bundle protein n=1 Tax=Gracilimonas aurantiaca TaxID=3234185 RepID=UPI003464FB5E